MTYRARDLPHHLDDLRHNSSSEVTGWWCRAVAFDVLSWDGFGESFAWVFLWGIGHCALERVSPFWSTPEGIVYRFCSLACTYA